MEELLGPKLVSAKGETIDTSTLAAKKTLSSAKPDFPARDVLVRYCM